ncbi:hypothetical protein [Ensifer soli]|uniref:hypothetical protein n=1 Tax=Ciceribacter sp. sgz301302 TaxID=3342379 RepID=UPI0035B75EF0
MTIAAAGFLLALTAARIGTARAFLVTIGGLLAAYIAAVLVPGADAPPGGLLTALAGFNAGVFAGIAGAAAVARRRQRAV